MRWLLLACVISLAGCGAKVDPRLCETCRKLDSLKNDASPEAAFERPKLRKKRDEQATSFAALYSISGDKMYIDCPLCETAYAEAIIADKKRDRR